MGIDIGLRGPDGTAIVISHKEKNNILIDYAHTRSTTYMENIIQWINNINKQYPIEQGLVDRYNGHLIEGRSEAKINSIHTTKLLDEEMTFNFESNKGIIQMSGWGCFRGNWETVFKNSNLKDALIRSIWLTVKNDPKVIEVTDKNFSFKYNFT
jgi:hypothetical protein